MRGIDAVAYTAGPGLAGALLVGASVAEALAVARGVPALPIHHLEGHLLSPMLSADPPRFPFVALLVSGGHTQLMRVGGVGDYVLLGESLDDAAGEAFDKTAKLLGLGYPGGPQLSRLAESGTPGRFKLPRPMLNSGDLSFSFSGLKTAVLTQVNGADAVGARSRRPGRRFSGGGGRRAGRQGELPRSRSADSINSSWRAVSVPTAICASTWMQPASSAASASSTRNSNCAPTTAR